MISLDEFRAQYHREASMIHLNNAGQSPMCRPARDAMVFWTNELYAKAAHGFLPMAAAMEEARGDVAKLLGARTEEVSFFPGTAAALSQVAFGVGLKAGDEVIVWDQEYPSNFYPWLEAAHRAGAVLVTAKSDAHLATPVEAIERLITPRTRVIAFSWVQYRTGAITELQAVSRLARQHGIFTCTDIIQGAGLYPFDFAASGVDAACGGSHKWLTAAHGAAYMILKEEHHARFQPLAVGAMTYGTPDTPLSLQPVIKSGHFRFEPGGKAFVEAIGLGAAARLLLAAGLENLAREGARLGARLITGLRERGYVIHSPHAGPHPGGIVNFSPGPKAQQTSLADIQSVLASAHVSFAVRPPGIRLAPHAFNTDDEIDRTLALL